MKPLLQCGQKPTSLLRRYIVRSGNIRTLDSKLILSDRGISGGGSVNGGISVGLKYASPATEATWYNAAKSVSSLMFFLFTTSSTFCSKRSICFWRSNLTNKDNRESGCYCWRDLLQRNLKTFFNIVCLLLGFETKRKVSRVTKKMWGKGGFCVRIDGAKRNESFSE